ncbi:MAG: insulinase family protein [Oscillospiraceae bacterium]|nr:insulinase family protein [Oscillospiraceae bacterium]
MRIGELIAGFELISTTPLHDIPGRLHMFRHIKTGAELVWTERRDNNKTFAITFKTIPEDDTGVFHILEHSVLCGSEKYPVKEPFVEILKGSLNTFLNAMTFPDKTMYPVASRNDADFMNLMRVYLDSVFCPAIYSNENIFLQEGWHYEADADGNTHYVGVVFGEMTGVFSSVDEVINTEMLRRLFPDNCYSCVSGGDPEHIPELSYKQFIKTHRRFYHPSNARVFLDGEVDICSVLSEIDREYFSKYERREADFKIAVQGPLPLSESTVYYAVSPDDNNRNRAHFALGHIVGDWREAEKNLALTVLQDYLASSNSSPLTRAILEQGLGQDVSFDVETGIAQTFYLLQIKNTSEEILPQIPQKLKEILCGLLDKGLDKDELTASINSLEFKARERTEPYGVGLAVSACRSWLYGGDPAMYLEFGETFNSLRGKLDTDYFEELFREIFFSEDGTAVLNVLPSETLEAENAEKQKERINSKLAAFTAEKRASIEKKSRNLAAWQQSPDSPAALAAIPHLELADIPEAPLLTEVVEETMNGVRLLRPRTDVQKTVYLDLYFALPHMDPCSLSAAALLTKLFLELPTKKRSASELQKAVKTSLGDMSFEIHGYSRIGDTNTCTPYFRASVSVLEDKLDAAISLLREVLCETELDFPEAVREVVNQNFSMHQQRIITAGHSYAMRHALSTLTAEGFVIESTNGYGYFDWLRGLCNDFDNSYPELLRSLEAVRALFTKANLTVSVTGKVGNETLSSLCSCLPAGVRQNAAFTAADISPRADAIIIPAGIGYAVKAADLFSVCKKIPGSMQLAAKLLSLDYLWNEVRVQGGAYGAGLQLAPNGSVFSYSYRDPNPARTLVIFGKASEYLRRYCECGNKPDRLIIGAVSDSEPLRSAHDESLASVARVLRGITEEQKILERKEFLNSDYETLMECVRILEEADRNSGICVISGENLADACSVSFDSKLSI